MDTEKITTVELTDKEVNDVLEFGELVDGNASNDRINAAALKVAYALDQKVMGKVQDQNDLN